nr:hypothetical protein [Plasticicumulans lactativorans]
MTPDEVNMGLTAEAAALVEVLCRVAISAGSRQTNSIKVAEAAKAIESLECDVSIARINDLASIFNRLGIDAEAVFAAAGAHTLMLGLAFQGELPGFAYHLDGGHHPGAEAVPRPDRGLRPVDRCRRGRAPIWRSPDRDVDCRAIRRAHRHRRPSRVRGRGTEAIHMLASPMPG